MNLLVGLVRQIGETIIYYSTGQTESSRIKKNLLFSSQISPSKIWWSVYVSDIFITYPEYTSDLIFTKDFLYKN